MPGLIRSEVDHGHKFVLIYDLFPEAPDEVWARCEACGETVKMGRRAGTPAQAGEFPESYQE